MRSWLLAIDTANNLVGNVHRNFHWNAVIGPSPGMEQGNHWLEGPTTVALLQLRPGGDVFPEYRDPPIPSLTGRNIFWSWPIIVDGESKAYDREVAVKSAVVKLHKLCGLLSLAWDRCWIVRQFPNIAEPGTATIQKPDSPDVNDTQIDRSPVSIPLWMETAWKSVDNDGVLMSALNGFYEGLKLQHHHPSFALVSYVASIETLGSKLHDLKSCAACNGTTGSLERFRQAMRLVVPAEADVKRLAKIAYERRSQTSHQARLYGTEPHFGAVFFEFFNTLTQGSPSMFTWTTVREIRKVSRDLLVGVFSEKIRLEA